MNLLVLKWGRLSRAEDELLGAKVIVARAKDELASAEGSLKVARGTCEY